MTPIRTAARTLLGALFVGSGWLALRNPDRLVTRAKPVTDRLSPALRAANLPTEPETLVKANGAIQLVGGVLLATGHLTRPAAAALAATVVPSTIAAHPFWTETDPQRRADQQVQFAKNLGLLGGLLFATVDRGGKPSLAWRTRYAARDARRTARAFGATAGLSGALAAKRAGFAVRRAGDAVSDTVGNAAWRASTAASDAGRSVRRTARTARREAKLAARAVQLGRSLPF
jgi:uncharacterized membrane protein YphA (DoxX/SURF4 family)